MRAALDTFKEAEILFLNEYAVGIGHDGEVWVGEDHQSFRKRIKAVPAILARRVDHREESVDLGKQWGKDLLEGHIQRSRVMHSNFGHSLPRITKQELTRYTKAVLAYFEELRLKLPTAFHHMEVLMDDATELRQSLRADGI
jgi:hypothetical protein